VYTSIWDTLYIECSVKLFSYDDWVRHSYFLLFESPFCKFFLSTWLIHVCRGLPFVLLC
ncbi:hypothetical protein L9F63_007231, partial [Diploptera punctata]